MRPASPSARSRSVVPDEELTLRVSRSGGPGGQHVNTASTRVEVRWNVQESAALTEAERELLLTRLGRRIDREGWLRVVASASRSQLRNREAATERLRALVAEALAPRATRLPTKVPRTERARRLRAKRHRGAVKRERRRVSDDE